jgi:tricorn protease
MVAFSWNGDIWLAQTKDGTARQLTQHPAADEHPRFSPDGKYLAFSSSRSGSRQVHLMPYVGGQPKQLTAHTEGFTVTGWHPDGQRVLTSITRDHFWRHAERFHLVNVTNRGPEEILFDDYGSDGRLSPDGRRLLFTREGERDWRKGYRGPRASQIWLHDLARGNFTQLIATEEESRWPLWKPDGKGFYYVAERDGVGNLRVRDLASKEERQLTHFTEDSVMYPALSQDGSTIVFRNLFDLWVLKTDGESKPVKLSIRNAADLAVVRTQRRTLKTATEIAYSKDGLEVAFIAGGDLWVMDTELREPVQITDTPSFEHDPAFSPDGKSIFFVGERDGQPDIFRVVRADEKRFWWQNEKFRFAQLTKDVDEEDSLKISPSGDLLAFTKGRGDLWTMRLDGKEAKRLFESWNTPQFNWSPDSRWLVYAQSDSDFNRDVWIRPIDDSRPPYNLSRHPDNDSNPVWSPDGKIIAFTGRRRGEETDIYYAMLRAEDHETDSRERKIRQAVDKLKKARAKKPVTKQGSPPRPAAKPADSSQAEPSEDAVEPNSQPEPDPKAAEESEEAGTGEVADKAKKRTLQIDFEDLHERLRHVSIPNSSESELVWSPDSKKLAFTASVEAKAGTYYIEPPDSLRPKLLNAKTGSQATWISTGNRILWLSGGVPGAVSGTTVSTHAFTARQEVRVSNQFREAFNQAWRTMRDSFYDENLGGRDWDQIREKYIGMAGECPDGASLADVINLMLGELNGSHLGFYYRGPTHAPIIPPDSWTLSTAHLGLRFASDHEGPGLRVRDVLKGGPTDRRESRIHAGELVVEIDGQAIGPATDLTRHLNGVAERDIRLTVRPGDDEAAEPRRVTVRPISYARARSLLYEKWIDDNQATVAAASEGTLGYVHIAGMNMTSFYRFEEELFSVAAGKEGLVIDVRENGGGSTTDHLLTVLTQPRHAITVPRGGDRGYPQDRMVYASWHKPIVVLCNQNSFSNAEIFSHAVRHLKRGKLVGVPTAGGVISTGGKTIMDIGYLRLPFRGWYGLADGQDMELRPAVPHHVLWPKPTELPAGKDVQLQKAIRVLRREVAKEQAKPELPLINASDR